MTEAEFGLRLLAGLVLGSVIGIERQWRQRTAGLRTNTLVSVGAALFVALSVGMEEDVSPTRVASQIVSGIGFLGAGVIIREGVSLRGIDTAATLWCAAAIGSLAGAGLFIMATGGTLAVIFANVVLRPLAARIEQSPGGGAEHEVHYRLRCRCAPPEEGRIRALLLQAVDDERLQLRSLSSRARAGGSEIEVRAELVSHGRPDDRVEDIVNRLSLDPDVTAASWERLSDDEVEEAQGNGRQTLFGPLGRR